MVKGPFLKSPIRPTDLLVSLRTGLATLVEFQSHPRLGKLGIPNSRVSHSIVASSLGRQLMHHVGPYACEETWTWCNPIRFRGRSRDAKACLPDQFVIDRVRVAGKHRRTEYGLCTAFSAGICTLELLASTTWFGHTTRNSIRVVWKN
jgi:hypothetical protein